MSNDTNSCVHFFARSSHTNTKFYIIIIDVIARSTTSENPGIFFSDNCLSVEKSSGYDGRISSIGWEELFYVKWKHTDRVIYMYTWRFANAFQLKLESANWRKYFSDDLSSPRYMKKVLSHLIIPPISHAKQKRNAQKRSADNPCAPPAKKQTHKVRERARFVI